MKTWDVFIYREDGFQRRLIMRVPVLGAVLAVLGLATLGGYIGMWLRVAVEVMQ